MSDVNDQAKSLETNMFLQNLVKLIPVEIIALFAVIKGLIPATANDTAVLVTMGLLAVLVPFYVIFAMKVTKVTQVVIMTLAFPIWIVATGGLPNGVTISWYEPWMMSVGLALFTLIPPMIYGKRLEEDKQQTVPVDENTTASVVVKAKSWREV